MEEETKRELIDIAKELADQYRPKKNFKIKPDEHLADWLQTFESAYGDLAKAVRDKKKG